MEEVSEQLIQLLMQYEEIAMHFNDPLIRLRTQALGGVATIVTVAGFLTSRQSTSGGSEPWGAVAAVSILLLFAWTTIWVIDVCYYSRLLSGAVVALLEIETARKGRIKFSHRVEQVVRRKAEVSISVLERRTGWQVKFFILPSRCFCFLRWECRFIWRFIEHDHRSEVERKCCVLRVGSFDDTYYLR